MDNTKINTLREYEVLMEKLLGGSCRNLSTRTLVMYAFFHGMMFAEKSLTVQDIKKIKCDEEDTDG